MVVFFLARGRFCDFGALGLLAAGVACCASGLDAGFFRFVSRCLFLLRK
jgi:hypothetical protein